MHVILGNPMKELFDHQRGNNPQVENHYPSGMSFVFVPHDFHLEFQPIFSAAHPQSQVQ